MIRLQESREQQRANSSPESIDAVPVIIYEADQRIHMGLLGSLLCMIRNLLQSRELIWQLTRRDLLSLRKYSALGLFWIVLSPLVGIVSWVFMDYAGMLRPGDVVVPYPLYVLFGTTIWGLFMNSYHSAAQSLTSSGSLMLQVNFPHEALVVQQIAQNVIGLVANVGVLLIVLVFFGVWPSWKAVFLPLALIPLLALGVAIGMFVSVLTVVVQDVSKVVTSGLGLLMFITPVIYAPTLPNQDLQNIISWNPLSYLVGGVRDLVLIGHIDRLDGFTWASCFSISMLVLSWRLFFVSEQKVAEKS
jgi:homopolymeric O-antigen transport system permease protein